MRGLSLALLIGTTACDGTPAGPIDAGLDANVIVINQDAQTGTNDAAPRLSPHENVTLPAMQLGIVYVGELDAGGAPSADTLVAWMLSSPYWQILEEYGIHEGSVAGSVRVPVSSFFQSGDVDGGLVDLMVLDQRVARAIHGDASPGVAAIDGAQAYLLYLPDDLNVALGQRGSYTYQTCIDANGYHTFDGLEPYAVLPPCPIGRSAYATAHELTEMATDPQPYLGWVSDAEIGSGGEVADICAEHVMQEGIIVTRLWSNLARRCVP